MAYSEAGETVAVETSGDLSKYVQLYNAALSGDWETANTLFFEKDIEETEAIISYEGETALHVAVQNGKANDFVRKLVQIMRPQSLALRDRYGYTALHSSAKVGNTEAATVMLEKSLDLLDAKNDEGLLAVTVAAQYGHKGTLKYLISKSKLDVENSPFKGNLGIDLFIKIIRCEFFDVAFDLLKKYPDLAKLRLENSDRCVLSYMAEMDTVFPNTFYYGPLNYLIQTAEYLMYHNERDESRPTSVAGGDIEDPTSRKTSTSSHINNGGKREEQFKGGMTGKVLEYLVPRVTKIVKDKREKHNPALELAKCLCCGMKSLPEKDAWNMFQDSMFRAAEHGISEIVQMIMEMHPSVTASVDGTGRNIMHLAVRNRFAKVFNLTYSMSDRKHLFSNGVDSGGNNLLHMCAQLAPPNRLNLTHGPALMMQRELLWFNEIQNFIPPSLRNSVNKAGKTPTMLFIEEHKDLKDKGEKWLKDTANACSITAALITTVMFAAAFTAPGGLSSETGIPVFAKEHAFRVFSAATAFSFFTSITSLMMFLSIITSRYAEEDLVQILPTSLIIGLLLLYVSIITMILSFGAAISFLFRMQMTVFFLLITTCGWWPVTAFILLQLPIHYTIFSSIYCRRMFGKRTDGMFY